MGFRANTTASLREGISTNNGTLVWTEVLSCTIASIVVLTFFIAPYRRWHTNPLLKLLLLASGAPVEKMLSYTLGIMQSTPYTNELHLVWATFLLIAYGSVFTSMGYSVNISRKERMEFEMSQFLDNFSVAGLIASFPGHSKFKRPLWALWCLIMVKWIQRIIGFRVANRRYGTENINLVADYMSYEHELTKYLVVGEGKAKTEIQAPDYLWRLDVTDKNVITMDKVWQCPGKLLHSDGNLAGRLKDVCLSFALFKLLRLRFLNCSAAEATHAFRGLLMEEKHERAFRVIKVELEFLHDLFCTKYPIIFSCWSPFFGVLQLFIIMISVWTAVSALHNYQTPKTDINRVVDGKNVDVIITYVFVILITIMEAWEFCCYWLSDWAKVTLICNYVKHPKPQYCFSLDKVLGIICRGKFWRPLSDKIGQYSLLENLRSNNCNIPCNVTCCFKADKKRKRVVKLSEEVKKAIFVSLRTEVRLSNGEFSLQQNGPSALSWACKLQSPTHTIMVWHIATSYFENDDHQKDTEHRKVATTLSMYCAYLLVFAPELLPVRSFAIKGILEKIESETRTFFQGCKSKKQMREKVRQNEDSGETVVGLGAKLAKQLECVHEERRWEVLAEFWAELIVFLAPSDNAYAHAEKLATGGEFITHLWALLYHAGIPGRGQSSQVHTFTSPSV
ncbi:hypothetical protein COCNU_scaffold004486G000070 [Cocos nucifera]|nr:hypothetical protein [Cocos nucifera]